MEEPSKIIKIKGKNYIENPFMHRHEKDAVKFLKTKFSSYSIVFYERLNKDKDEKDNWLCIATHNSSSMKITTYKRTFFELMKSSFRNIDMVENFS
jgi:hypothetical protein